MKLGNLIEILNESAEFALTTPTHTVFHFLSPKSDSSLSFCRMIKMGDCEFQSLKTGINLVYRHNWRGGDTGIFWFSKLHFASSTLKNSISIYHRIFFTETLAYCFAIVQTLIYFLIRQNSFNGSSLHATVYEFATCVC